MCMLSSANFLTKAPPTVFLAPWPFLARKSINGCYDRFRCILSCIGGFAFRAVVHFLFSKKQHSHIHTHDKHPHTATGTRLAAVAEGLVTGGHSALLYSTVLHTALSLNLVHNCLKNPGLHVLSFFKTSSVSTPLSPVLFFALLSSTLSLSVTWGTQCLRGRNSRESRSVIPPGYFYPALLYAPDCKLPTTESCRIFCMLARRPVTHEAGAAGVAESPP